MSGTGERPRPEWAHFVRLAWTSAGSAFVRMTPLFLSAIVLYALFGLTERWFYFVCSAALLHVSPTSVVMVPGVMIGIIMVAIEALLLAPVAVAVHRFVLLDEVSTGFSILRQPCLRNFAVWTFCIELGLGAVDMFASLTAIWLFGAVASVGSFILFARTLLVFPSVAIETPSAGAMDRIEASFSASRGLFWTTFFAVIVACLPLFVIGFLPAIAADVAISRHIDLSTAAWVSDVVNDVAHPMIVAVLAALASWLLLWSREHPYEAKPQPQESHAD